VGGHGTEVGAERIEGDGDVTRGRTRVEVHEHTAFAQRGAHFRNWLQCPDFVVRELDADEFRIGPHRVDDRGRVEPTETVDTYDGQVAAIRPAASRTHECSTAVVTTCPAPLRASAPTTAVFTASVPDDVKTTSRGRARRTPRPVRG